MRTFFATLVVFLYAILCYACWWLYRRSQPRSEYPPAAGADTWLIAYASQGGMASQLALQSTEQLRRAGFSVLVVALNRVDEAMLREQRKILLVASTFGEGEAPDNGSRFLSRCRNLDLRHLQYGLLALGDRHYRYFCGFGHLLDHALRAGGATPLFDMIEVDKGDVAALRHWQYYLGQIGGQPLFHDWTPPQYETWILSRRLCLNQGSPGAPVYWLQLRPAVNAIQNAQWQAGDIAEVGPCNSVAHIENFLSRMSLDPADPSLHPKLWRRDLRVDDARLTQLKSQPDETWMESLGDLPHREYSIASTPDQGTLDLLVRQVRHGPDAWGLGSGWLTQFATEGGEILLRVRSNPGFHPPADNRPLILIGNGTGMAGLRAHLLWRRQRGAKNNWLLFGERTEAHDFFFREEIDQWHQEGFLSHLDLAFSRDARPGIAPYVQDLLPARREALQNWVNAGAAIFVCGSLTGMAKGVDEALTQILGRPLLDQMVEERRYCRDIY